MSGRWSVVSILALTVLPACSDDAGNGDAGAWQVVHEELPGALLSVWGTSEHDVWAVGADDGDGPTVIHYDGAGWQRLATGESGDLWWVHGFAGGAVFMGGQDGMILRYRDGAFSRMTTPGQGAVFGIWGASEDELWAVGGALGGASGAFVWRSDGGDWAEAAGFPAEIADTDALWKVAGRGPDDVWMVGTRGTALHWDGAQLVQDDIPTEESLFTLAASSERFVAVGGFGTGSIFELRVDSPGDGWTDVTPAASVEPLIGVAVTEDTGYAVGQYATVLRFDGRDWLLEDTGLQVFESLHGVWVDPTGGVWAAGGQVQAFPLIRGVLIHHGPEQVPGGDL